MERKALVQLGNPTDTSGGAYLIECELTGMPAGYKHEVIVVKDKEGRIVLTGVASKAKMDFKGAEYYCTNARFSSRPSRWDVIRELAIDNLEY